MWLLFLISIFLPHNDCESGTKDDTHRHDARFKALIMETNVCYTACGQRRVMGSVKTHSSEIEQYSICVNIPCPAITYSVSQRIDIKHGFPRSLLNTFLNNKGFHTWVGTSLLFDDLNSPCHRCNKTTYSLHITLQVRSITLEQVYIHGFLEDPLDLFTHVLQRCVTDTGQCWKWSYTAC